VLEVLDHLIDESFSGATRRTPIVTGLNGGLSAWHAAVLGGGLRWLSTLEKTTDVFADNTTGADCHCGRWTVLGCFLSSMLGEGLGSGMAIRMGMRMGLGARGSYVRFTSSCLISASIPVEGIAAPAGAAALGSVIGSNGILNEPLS